MKRSPNLDEDDDNNAENPVPMIESPMTPQVDVSQSHSLPPLYLEEGFQGNFWTCRCFMEFCVSRISCFILGLKIEELSSPCDADIDEFNSLAATEEEAEEEEENSFVEMPDEEEEDENEQQDHEGRSRGFQQQQQQQHRHLERPNNLDLFSSGSNSQRRKQAFQFGGAR
jgi:hypothetical protein